MQSKLKYIITTVGEHQDVVTTLKLLLVRLLNFMTSIIYRERSTIGGGGGGGAWGGGGGTGTSRKITNDKGYIW